MLSAPEARTVKPSLDRPVLSKVPAAVAG